VADKKANKNKVPDEEEDLRKGNLFATGLVAGGALFGVIAAILTVFFESGMKSVNLEEVVSHGLGNDLYMILGVGFFAAMAFILWRVATRKNKTI
jgi:hypothetical protein